MVNRRKDEELYINPDSINVGFTLLVFLSLLFISKISLLAKVKIKKNITQNEIENLWKLLIKFWRWTDRWTHADTRSSFKPNPNLINPRQLSLSLLCRFFLILSSFWWSGTIVCALVFPFRILNQQVRHGNQCNLSRSLKWKRVQTDKFAIRTKKGCSTGFSWLLLLFYFPFFSFKVRWFSCFSPSTVSIFINIEKGEKVEITSLFFFFVCSKKVL
jgi:hypothetical protein